MKLPKIDDAPRYQGLYIFDFGPWCAVGYTAEELAVLLEQEAYRAGKVYRIHRATPDGCFELRGVSRARFQLESGMFFSFRELDAARADFQQLQQAAASTPPPCRAFLHLADRGESSGACRYCLALIFPAEFEDDMGRWLTAIGYDGGELAEGGISHVTDYYQEQNAIVERAQLWGGSAIPSRSPQQVLASVRQALQR